MAGNLWLIGIIFVILLVMEWIDPTPGSLVPTTAANGKGTVVGLVVLLAIIVISVFHARIWPHDDGHLEEGDNPYTVQGR